MNGKLTNIALLSFQRATYFWSARWYEKFDLASNLPHEPQRSPSANAGRLADHPELVKECSKLFAVATREGRLSRSPRPEFESVHLKHPSDVGTIPDELTSLRLGGQQPPLFFVPQRRSECL
jgi:hypothetical protein